MNVPRTRFTSVARKLLYRRARAPLAPMVPTPMRLFRGLSGKRYCSNDGDRVNYGRQPRFEAA